MRTKGTVCIGRSEGVYYFIDSVFKHSDDFGGCTGYEVRPVSAKEYEEASKFESVAERLQDVWDCMTDKEVEHLDVCCDCCERPCFDKWVEEAIRLDGIDHLMFDPSYNHSAGKEFDSLGISYESTDCIGGGRIFSGDTDYDEVYNEEALKAIRNYESGLISYDTACRAVFGEVWDGNG